MAVIIRDDRTIAGKKVKNVRVYRSDRPVTREAREKAEELDFLIHQKMSEIADKMKVLGLLDKMGKPGVLELWYNVGKNLGFVMDPSIVPVENRKYVWRALYDHAGPLHTGPLPVRIQKRPKSSHFRYCYLLSEFKWAFVKSAGNWSAWVEFFDSPVIYNDERIIEWLISKQKFITGSRQNWVRKLNRAIRNELKNKDTSVFTDKELNKMLEMIYNSVFNKKLTEIT